MTIQYCNTCGKVMDTGRVADANCGGDCLKCMADVGDLDCIRALEVENIRTTLITLSASRQNLENDLRNFIDDRIQRFQKDTGVRISDVFVDMIKIHEIGKMPYSRLNFVRVHMDL